MSHDNQARQQNEGFSSNPQQKNPENNINYYDQYQSYQEKFEPYTEEVNYPNGKKKFDAFHNHVFYPNGNKVFDGFHGHLFYPDGDKAFDFFHGHVYYTDNNQLYDAFFKQLKFENGNKMTKEDANRLNLHYLRVFIDKDECRFEFILSPEFTATVVLKGNSKSLKIHEGNRWIVEKTV